MQENVKAVEPEQITCQDDNSNSYNYVIVILANT